MLLGRCVRLQVPPPSVLRKLDQLPHSLGQADLLEVKSLWKDLGTSTYSVSVKGQHAFSSKGCQVCTFLRGTVLVSTASSTPAQGLPRSRNSMKILEAK